MNRLLFFSFCMIFFVAAKGQKNYAEAMQQGDDAFKNGQYKTAINKYFAAEAFDPTKKNIVKDRVNIVFDAIEALRKKAEIALAEAKKQTNLAIEAKKEAEKQTNLALEAKKEAEKQKDIAQWALKQNIEIKEMAIGKKYKGGIIFNADSKREHGLIAAEKDLDSLYTWEAAKKACEDYAVVIDGVTYDDWFLPSKDTLDLLYHKRSEVGSFSDGTYWSSSEFNNGKNNAWNQYFGNADLYPGYQDSAPKSHRYRVRAVRAF